jgi:hypothetical protein
VGGGRWEGGKKGGGSVDGRGMGKPKRTYERRNNYAISRPGVVSRTGGEGQNRWGGIFISKHALLNDNAQMDAPQ